MPFSQRLRAKLDQCLVSGDLENFKVSLVEKRDVSPTQIELDAIEQSCHRDRLDFLKAAIEIHLSKGFYMYVNLQPYFSNEVNTALASRTLPHHLAYQMYYAIIHRQPDEVDVGKSYPFDWVYILNTKYNANPDLVHSSERARIYSRLHWSKLREVFRLKVHVRKIKNTEPAAYVKEFVKTLNRFGNAHANPIIYSALIALWAVTRKPKTSLPSELALMVAGAVLKSMSDSLFM